MLGPSTVSQNDRVLSRPLRETLIPIQLTGHTSPVLCTCQTDFCPVPQCGLHPHPRALIWSFLLHGVPVPKQPRSPTASFQQLWPPSLLASLPMPASYHPTPPYLPESKLWQSRDRGCFCPSLCFRTYNHA